MEAAPPTIVVDTNVLLNLALPVVDRREIAPTGADPLRVVLTAYDVHTPSSVLGELVSASQSEDLLGAAADLVLLAASHLTTHDVEAQLEQPLEYGLDEGESHGIWLTNELDAEMFVTDEFNSTNYLLVSLALDDRNALFTTPHVLCSVASHGLLDTQYVDAALSYFVQTKGWDRGYVQLLRGKYLRG
jgi:rRNA-processing protein FCF1